MWYNQGHMRDKKTVRVEVSMWYNQGYMRDKKQYVLRCLCGIIKGA